MTGGAEQNSRWIAEFEADGEQAVRDSMNFKGGIVTGGEAKLSTARKWLRDKEKNGKMRPAIAKDMRRPRWHILNGRFGPQLPELCLLPLVLSLSFSTFSHGKKGSLWVMMLWLL
jgi:hypothetical protein